MARAQRRKRAPRLAGCCQRLRRAIRREAVCRERKSSAWRRGPVATMAQHWERRWSAGWPRSRRRRRRGSRKRKSGKHARASPCRHSRPHRSRCRLLHAPTWHGWSGRGYGRNGRARLQPAWKRHHASDPHRRRAPRLARHAWPAPCRRKASTRRRSPAGATQPRRAMREANEIGTSIRDRSGCRQPVQPEQKSALPGLGSSTRGVQMARRAFSRPRVPACARSCGRRARRGPAWSSSQPGTSRSLRP